MNKPLLFDIQKPLSDFNFNFITVSGVVKQYDSGDKMSNYIDCNAMLESEDGTQISITRVENVQETIFNVGWFWTLTTSSSNISPETPQLILLTKRGSFGVLATSVCKDDNGNDLTSLFNTKYENYLLDSDVGKTVEVTIGILPLKYFLQEISFTKQGNINSSRVDFTQELVVKFRGDYLLVDFNTDTGEYVGSEFISNYIGDQSFTYAEHWASHNVFYFLRPNPTKSYTGSSIKTFFYMIRDGNLNAVVGYPMNTSGDYTGQCGGALVRGMDFRLQRLFILDIDKILDIANNYEKYY